MIRKSTSRTFHRRLYGTILQMITLLKRGDDQQEGTVTKYLLYECRQSMITKTGEPIAGDMLSNHRCSFHIPRLILDNAGIWYINPADQIIDYEGATWQPESTTQLTNKLITDHVCVDALMVSAGPYGNP